MLDPYNKSSKTDQQQHLHHKHVQTIFQDPPQQVQHQSSLGMQHHHHHHHRLASSSRTQRLVFVFFIAALVLLFTYLNYGLKYTSANTSSLVDAAKGAQDSSDVSSEDSEQSSSSSSSSTSPDLYAMPSNDFYKDTNHLVIVPGHAVFMGYNFREYRNPKNWAIEKWQQHVADAYVEAIVEHIKLGLEELRDDPKGTLLVFSGGQTRPYAGPRTEAQGYFNVAEANDFLGMICQAQGKSEDGNNDDTIDATQQRHRRCPEYLRIFTEEFARDSYENVLFSICRFHEITGRYPAKITVTGFEYKRRRFTDVHRYALQFPVHQFVYKGLDMKQGSGTGTGSGVAKLSDDKTLKRTLGDIYLCHANKETRKKRNPMHRPVPYYNGASCPQILPLLTHCGPKLFGGFLPWRQR